MSTVHGITSLGPITTTNASHSSSTSGTVLLPSFWTSLWHQQQSSKALPYPALCRTSRHTLLYSFRALSKTRYFEIERSSSDKLMQINHTSAQGTSFTHQPCSKLGFRDLICYATPPHHKEKVAPNLAQGNLRVQDAAQKRADT